MFQKVFDKESYVKHNIDIMDPKVLANACSALGAEVVYSEYSGKFAIWLENEHSRSVFLRLLRKSLSILGRLLAKALPVKTRFLSPFIILKAIKY